MSLERVILFLNKIAGRLFKNKNTRSSDIFGTKLRI